MVHEEQFTPEEQALVDRLHSSPQPRLRLGAFETIQQRIFQEMEGALPPARTPASLVTPKAIVVAIAVVIIIVIVIMVVRNGQPQPSSEVILTPSDTTEPTPVPTGTVAVETTPELIIELTQEPTKEVTASPISEIDEVLSIVEIEGPIESIQANIITIYSFEIELPENDPRITVIQVGDILHVRGHHSHDRGALVIVALVFDFVDIDVIVFEGQVWRDTLSCALAPPAWADTLAVHWHGRCDPIITVPGVPAGCKITGMGGIKCSNR
jgi:hypothetical protein